MNKPQSIPARLGGPPILPVAITLHLPYRPVGSMKPTAADRFITDLLALIQLPKAA